MADKYADGFDHVHTHDENDPLDSHVCRSSVCKRMTGRDDTSVVYFAWPARTC